MFVDTRSSGVLMHISSLPGPFGVGVLGKEALDFIDLISELGFSYWQVLPLNPTDEFYSPYKSHSAFAGNYLFIDPRYLNALGLVTQDEVNACVYSDDFKKINYDFVSEKMISLLKVAFSRAGSSILTSIDDFSSKHTWVEPYALYMAVKDSQNGKPWWQWSAGYNDYEYCKTKFDLFTNQINFWKFTQYIFYSQWAVLKTYANSKGIKIIGDMPFYISMDSADVWSNLYYFQVDFETLKPTRVSGAPPDYFSKHGQIWGNPLYNWSHLEDEGYSWWVSRFEFLNNNFDAIRVTHFRAFASYWSVPADAEKSSQGKWYQGPGQKLFNIVKNKVPDLNLIADDLGRVESDVADLLESSQTPGIRVMLLGLEEEDDNKHLPHNYSSDSIAYLGTHDNNTFIGSLYKLTNKHRDYVLQYCGFCGSDWTKCGRDSLANRCALETLWRSPAILAIAPMQDLCAMSGSSRMNTPGTQKGNWIFRVTNGDIADLDKNYLKRLNTIFYR